MAVFPDAYEVTGDEPLRKAWVEVDLAAIERNAQILRDEFAPAELCAVVKADGYGHGAVQVARAVLVEGVNRLAVALVEEGIVLRKGGITAPIHILSEPEAAVMDDVVGYDLIPTLYTLDGLDGFDAAIRRRGSGRAIAHIKVDTGMNRVGVGVDEAVEFVQEAKKRDAIEVGGLFTHMAVAGEVDNPFTEQQGQRFAAVCTRLRSKGLLPPRLHAANSAAGLYFADLRLSMVRSGIALYGISPAPGERFPADIEPAMAVHARVSYVHRAAGGETVSYGRNYMLDGPANIATVPVGYADGVPRNLSANGGDVLIRGTRRPIVGDVTMDQLMIDCGDDAVQRGDEVVLIGTQANESITAQEWADRTGTIPYEIVCRIGPRLPRYYRTNTDSGRPTLRSVPVSDSISIR